MLGWVEVCSRQDFSESTTLGVLLAKLEFIDRHITPSSLAEFLTDRYVTDYVNVNGIDSLERILPCLLYTSYVEERDKLNEIKKGTEKLQEPENRYREGRENISLKNEMGLGQPLNLIDCDEETQNVNDFLGQKNTGLLLSLIHISSDLNE